LAPAQTAVLHLPRKGCFDREIAIKWISKSAKCAHVQYRMTALNVPHTLGLGQSLGGVQPRPSLTKGRLGHHPTLGSKDWGEHVSSPPQCDFDNALHYPSLSLTRMGPLSPWLANIMLDDLDKELEKRGHRFVRYADDCNTLALAGTQVPGSM